MRALILGAGGMLGHDLQATAPRDVALFPFPRDSLDVTDARAVAAAVADVRPHVVINAAGYTAVVPAQSAPEPPFPRNPGGVRWLGRVAGRGGGGGGGGGRGRLLRPPP